MAFPIVTLIVVLVCGSLGAGCQTGGQPSAEMQQKLFAGAARPSSNSAQVLRSVHYFKLMGRFDLAVKELQEATEREPEDARLLNALGSCYDEMGEFAKAQGLYQRVLSQEPGNLAALNNMGYSRYLAGDWQGAESYYQQVLARDPKNLWAANNLGLLWCRQGSARQARQLWQKLEGEARAHEKLTQVLAKLGGGPVDSGAATAAALPPSRGPEKAPAPPRMEMAATPPASASVAPFREEKDKAATAPQAPEKPRPEVAKAPAPAAAPPPPVKGSQPQAEMAAVPKDPSPVVKPAASPTAVPSAEAPAASKEKEKVASLEAAITAAAPEAESAAPAAKIDQPAPARLADSGARPPGGAGHMPEHTPESQEAAAADLEKVAVEIRNGNGAPEIADLARDLLKGNGVRVRLIGNHIDFGVPETIVYYRPRHQEAAAELNRRFFQAARLERVLDLRGEVDIKVLLGHDILKTNLFFSHLKTTYPMHSITAAAPAPGRTVAGTAAASPSASTRPLTVASLSNAVNTHGPVDGGHQDRLPAAKILTPAAPAAPAATTAVAPAAKVAVEIRNGTWTPDLARFTRELLRGQGYRVPIMGNHIDFGAQETVIYYRPGKEEAAKDLNARVFHAKRLEPSTHLRPGVDLKVLLGKDLFRNCDRFASWKAR